VETARSQWAITVGESPDIDSKQQTPQSRSASNPPIFDGGGTEIFAAQSISNRKMKRFIAVKGAPPFWFSELKIDGQTIFVRWNGAVAAMQVSLINDLCRGARHVAGYEVSREKRGSQRHDLMG
jgi:hypothetical protein